MICGGFAIISVLLHTKGVQEYIDERFESDMSTGSESPSCFPKAIFKKTYDPLRAQEGSLFILERQLYSALATLVLAVTTYLNYYCDHVILSCYRYTKLSGAYARPTERNPLPA